MKRIHVAVPHDNDCLRCERVLHDAGIPFKLMVQKDSHLLIHVGDRGLRPALDALHRADFVARRCLNGNAN